MDAMIDVQNVTKSFSYVPDRSDNVKLMLVNLLKGKKNPHMIEKKILDDVSFSITPGEFVGIMGRNGAGKSTILKLISGIYTPDKGNVSINGKVAPLLELGAGFAPDLSGYENIFLNASIIGFNREQTLAKVEKIVEFSELKDRIYTPVKNYSSGMTMRLGFSIAAHLEAQIVLFDEVLGVGDVGFQLKCARRIGEMWAEGRTIVLVSHSPEQVAHVCSRCILINDHKIVYDGEAKTGAKKYQEIFGV